MNLEERCQRDLLLRPDFDALVLGRTGVERRPEGTTLLRLTASQIAVLQDRKVLALRGTCNAGQVIEFQTNSSTVDLECSIIAATRSCLGIDVEIDGVLRATLRDDRPHNPIRLRLFECEESSRWRRIRIHLPHGLALRLERLLLAPGAQALPVSRPGSRLLCLGDSITQGLNAVSPYHTYPSLLARSLGAELLNQGMTAHVLEPALVPTGLTPAPDLVTVAYGTNEWAEGWTASKVRQVLAAFLERLGELVPCGVPVVVISPIWRTDAEDERPGGRLASFAGEIEAAAADLGAFPVAGLRLVPHVDSYFDDGAHPTEEGHVLFARNLICHLSSVLRSISHGRVENVPTATHI